MFVHNKLISSLKKSSQRVMHSARWGYNNTTSITAVATLVTIPTHASYRTHMLMRFVPFQANPSTTIVLTLYVRQRKKTMHMPALSLQGSTALPRGHHVRTQYVPGLT